MAKIGRNEQCPCRSGKKFKHCCALKEQKTVPQPTPEQALRITLMGDVQAIQQQAVSRRAKIRELGVFFLYSTEKGDGWLFEMTGGDCVQVAKGGEALEAPIAENPETIEINWSHTFAIRHRQVEITAYADQAVSVLADAPSRELKAAMNRIRRKFTEEQLQKVHLPHPAEKSTAS